MRGREPAPNPTTPRPAPGPAALRLSRKMVWESLRGREGRPHHSPLNVNYAFKTVFIGEAARHPMPPRPVCVLPRPALRAARHAQVLRGGAHPVTERARGRRACLRRCGQSMRANVMGPRGRCARWSPSCRGRMHTVSAGEAVGGMGACAEA